MGLRNRLTFLAAGIGLIAVGRRVLQKKLDIQDKVVLITGGSRGLGLAVAEEFASQGAKLVLCARNAQELTEYALAMNRSYNRLRNIFPRLKPQYSQYSVM